MLRPGQFEAEALGFRREEAVRDLDHDAGAVAGLGIGTHGAAMLEVLEDGQSVGHHAMALGIVDIGDEADAAGVVLVARIVETVRFGKPLWQHVHVHGQLLLRPFPSLVSHASGWKPVKDRVVPCLSREGETLGVPCPVRRSDQRHLRRCPGLPLRRFTKCRPGHARGVDSRFGRRFQVLCGRIPEHPGPLALKFTTKGQ